MLIPGIVSLNPWFLSGSLCKFQLHVLVQSSSDVNRLLTFQATLWPERNQFSITKNTVQDVLWICISPIIRHQCHIYPLFWFTFLIDMFFPLLNTRFFARSLPFLVPFVTALFNGCSRPIFTLMMDLGNGPKRS